MKMRKFVLSSRLFVVIALCMLAAVSNLALAKMESETAHTAEENAKDKGGLLEDEYAGIDFSHDATDGEGDDADDRFLPQNMLSVVFTTKTKCFFEEIKKGNLLRGAWFLTTSGSTPIIVRVKDMSGGHEKILHEEQHDEEDTGGFTVQAETTGTYAYCFEHVNFPSEKDLVITFAVDVSTPSSVKTKAGMSALKADHIYPLQRSTTNLYNTLQSLVSELEVILLRVDRHVQTQDSTETRVSLLTFVETVAIAGITAFQIYFVRRLVNKSRQWV